MFEHMWGDQVKWVGSWSDSISFFWLMVYIICKPTFYNRPWSADEIGQLIPKTQAVEGLQNQQQTYKLTALSVS